MNVLTANMIALLLAPLALAQASPPPAPAPAPNSAAAQSAGPANAHKGDKPSSLAGLPIEQATAPRCGIAFAIVQGWQNQADPRGEAWPAINQGQGREFFVVAMARLIDDYNLTNEDVTRLVRAEVERLSAQNGQAVSAMMPACFTLLDISKP